MGFSPLLIQESMQWLHRLSRTGFSSDLEVGFDALWQQQLTCFLLSHVGWVELGVVETEVGSAAAVERDTSPALTELSCLLSCQCSDAVVTCIAQTEVLD